MSTFTGKVVIGFLLAMVIAAGTVGPSSARNADAIREKCIGLAGNNNLTGNPEDTRGRARLEIYTSCMQQHGLNP